MMEKMSILDNLPVTLPYPEWQPIETAPKDGTEFVMLDVETKTATVGKWMADVDWMNAGRLPGQAAVTPRWFPLATPTHWLALPELPGTESEPAIENETRK